VSRDPQLSHDEHVERGVEFSSNFESYRNAASRQTENKDIRTVSIRFEIPGEYAAGICPITKIHNCLRNRLF